MAETEQAYLVQTTPAGRESDPDARTFWLVRASQGELERLVDGLEGRGMLTEWHPAEERRPDDVLAAIDAMGPGATGTASPTASPAEGGAGGGESRHSAGGPTEASAAR